MQSFKQFLTEAVSYPPQHWMDFRIKGDALHMRQDTPSELQVMKAIGELGYDVLRIHEQMISTIRVIVELDNPYYRDDDLAKMSRAIRPILEKLYDSKTVIIDRNIVYKHNFTTNVQVETWKVTLDFDNAMLPVSLKDIHKTLKSALHITISNPLAIQSDVMGLMMVKQLEDIKLDKKNERDVPKWLTIMKEYLPTKDVLGYQEALIEAGLKQYAKF